MKRIGLFFVTGALFILSPAYATTSCMITLEECPLQPGAASPGFSAAPRMTFVDNANGAGHNQAACHQRADQIKNMCGTSQKVTADFIRDGRTIETTVAAGFTPPANATTQFYIDPISGSDNNAGTSTSAAWLTIAHAQSIVQATKKQNGNAAITVWLRGGNYFRPTGSTLSAPFLTFTSADSGNSGQLISWAAYVNPSTGVAESPVISGGISLTDFSPSFGSVLAAQAGSTHFRQLYLQQWDNTLRHLTSQTRLTRARFPAANAPDLTLTLPVEQSWTRGSSGLFAAVPAGGDSSWMSGQSTINLNQTEVVMRKSFGMTRLQIASTGTFGSDASVTFAGILSGNTSGVSPVDLEVCGSLAEALGSNAAALCGMGPDNFFGPFYYNQLPTDPGANGIPTNQNNPFHYENNIDFIQNPGDWFEDITSGTTWVFPPTGVTLPTGGFDTLIVMAPQGQKPGDNEVLLQLAVPASGGCTTSNQISNVQFVGLTFSHSNWLYPSYNGFVGFGYPQYRNGFMKDSNGSFNETTAFVPSAVQLGCTNNVTFADNNFSQLGAGAITDLIPGDQFAAPGNSQQLLLYGNAFTQIAGGGVELINTNGNITVTSNLFVNLGQDYGGTALVVDGPLSVSVMHNDVRFVSSQGITVAEQPFNPPIPPNTPWWQIEENVVSNIGLDYTDVGGIYTNESNDNFHLAFTNLSTQTPKVSISFNQVNALSVPSWFPVTGTVSPAGIYLDFDSEGVAVEDNFLTNMSRSFHLNCESNNLIVNNNAVLNSNYGGCGGVPASFVLPPSPFSLGSTIPPGSNNTSVALAFPMTPGLFPDASTLWAPLLAQFPTTTPTAP